MRQKRTAVQPQIAVFRNVFSIVVSTQAKNIPSKPAKLTFQSIQKWIDDTYGIKISKSSISQVKDKCGIEKIEINAQYKEIPLLNSKKEQLVLEAFKHFNIVQD
ncbi:MAG: hypothetical protein ACI4DN_08140 [Lachnospiraceae bacterium]